jgi:two-component system cell cycle sensor histidine kinase/response regulator CckA
MNSSRPVALIVDDEPDTRDVARRILEREHWVILDAHNGREALRLLKEHPEVALLIADVNMPEMNGLLLADIARSRRPDLKVLYMTGYSDRVFERRSVLPEHEAFLDKPFTAKGLCEAASLLVFGRLHPRPRDFRR